jgi:hypothetical protein
VAPVKGGSQMHLNPLMLSMQLPPFLQGLLRQSSIFSSQLIPVNPGGHVHL